MRLPAHWRRRVDRSRGFTLIELLTVVAIVGILAAIAYPAYTNSVLKGKRSEGRAALLGLIQQQERYFTQNNTYVTFQNPATSGTDAAGNTITPIPFAMTSGANNSSASYNLSAAVCPGSTDLRSCVLATATPNFSDPAVQSLTLQSTGAKGCTTGASICWGAQ